MVALNKPTAGDTDWTTEINDNWTALEGSIGQAICQGRLTLSSGNPVYNPQSRTPSSTDTGADTVSFASAHGWTTGTMVTPSATGGGLTAGTTYYLNVVDSDTVSLHNNITDAESGASKVNLTASITAELRALGVARKSLYFAPYQGNRIALYSGSTWNIRSFSELTLSLTMTSGKNYDVFVYDNSGAATLELSAAWTDDTTRADALTTQDGILVKSAATTRRYVGTIRAYEANAAQDSQLKRFVVNCYNRKALKLKVTDIEDSWTYTLKTWQAWHGSSANRVEFISNGEDSVYIVFMAMAMQNNNRNHYAGIDMDGTTTNDADVTIPGGTPTSFNRQGATAIYNSVPSEGYHYAQALEASDEVGTTFWYGDNGEPTFAQSGMTGWVMG